MWLPGREGQDAQGEESIATRERGRGGAQQPEDQPWSQAYGAVGAGSCALGPAVPSPFPRCAGPGKMMCGLPPEWGKPRPLLWTPPGLGSEPTSGMAVRSQPPAQRKRQPWPQDCGVGLAGSGSGPRPARGGRLMSARWHLCPSLPGRWAQAAAGSDSPAGCHTRHSEPAASSEPPGIPESLRASVLISGFFAL